MRYEWYEKNGWKRLSWWIQFQKDVLSRRNCGRKGRFVDTVQFTEVLDVEMSHGFTLGYERHETNRICAVGRRHGGLEGQRQDTLGGLYKGTVKHWVG